LGVTAGVGFWTFIKPPTYEGKVSFKVENPSKNEQDLSQAFIGSFGMPDVDFETEIEVLKSSSVLLPVIEELTQKYPDLEREEFEEILKIKQLKDTKILEVTYEDKDPQKIKFILDKLSETYLKRSLQERKGDIKEGIKFVETQLPRLKKKVDSLQTQLQEFRQQYNLIDPEQQATELTRQLVEIEKNYFQAQVELRQAVSAYGTLQEQLNLSPQQAIAVSYLTESPRYQNLLQQLQDVEVELAVQSATYTDLSPQILTVKEKRDNVLRLLRKETQALLNDKLGNVSDRDSVALSAPSKIRSELTQEFVFKANEIKVLETRTNGLNKVLNDLNQRLRQMPFIARKYTDLQREINVSTASLTRFLEAREKLQLQEAQQSLDWQVIAAPEEPEKPIDSPIRNLALGFIGGLALGLGAALLADKLDGSIHSLEELKEVVKEPILGHIPAQKNVNAVEEVLKKALPQFKIKSNNRPSWLNKTSEHKGYNSSYWLESFRNLYTNIRLLGSSRSVNSLVISSASPSEGKSTVSLNLAQSAAAMGQKVLLIDADLRLPKIHKRLGLTEHKGLSNILATGLELEEMIQELPQWENLSVLAAGDTPPDPTRLLSSQSMKKLMEKLNQEDKYDLIIYDTPPALGFADARIIAPSTNGMILVVKMGQTERSAIKHAIEQLKISNASILGLVANGVDRDHQGSYYHYGHYNKYYNANHANSEMPDLTITKNNN
jgi:capsular exopolysaccharide synthesis family protein